MPGLSDYFVFVLVRDAKDGIDQTLGSLVWQTHCPHRIIVIDDGSTDGTSEIIAKYVDDYPGMVVCSQTGSTTRDYRRLVRLWNRSMSIADMTTHGMMCEQHDGESCAVHCAYHMISGGDSKYEPDYAEKIVRFMDKNRDVAVCSGDYGTLKAKAPHGAGRFVRQDFFYDHYEEYPEIIGYESEILFRALFAGYDIAVVHEARYDHLDKLGHSHNFVEFGYAMRALGYYFPYVLAKVALEAVRGGGVGPKGAWNILKSYLTFKERESPTDGRYKYYSYFDEAFRRQVRAHQKRLMLKRLFGDRS